MKKKDAKLPPPKKLKLDQYEILQTLGTGNNSKEILLRIFWKGQDGKRDKDKKILCREDIKESRNHKAEASRSHCIRMLYSWNN